MHIVCACIFSISANAYLKASATRSTSDCRNALIHRSIFATLSRNPVHTLCKPCENSWTQHMRRHAYIHMYIWTFEYLISSEVTVKVCILPHCLLDRTAVRLHNSIHFNLQLLEAIREGLVSNLAATLLLFLFIFF